MDESLDILKNNKKGVLLGRVFGVVDGGSFHV